MSSTTLAMIVAAVVAAIIRAWLRRRDALTPAVSTSEPAIELSATPDTPRNFGYRSQWLAIRETTTEAVVTALALERTEPANWETGLAASAQYGEPRIWVSPPVDGWVFAVGVGLPDAGDASRRDTISPLLRSLARSFPCIRFFATDRVVEYHAWARLDRGKMVRQFAYLGDQGATLWDKGKPTPEEADIVSQYFADKPPAGETDSYFDRTDLRFPDEEDVLRMAERWSVNVMELEKSNGAAMVGMIGSLPDPNAPPPESREHA